jgi:AraC-like DNA-binding protein
MAGPPVCRLPWNPPKSTCRHEMRQIQLDAYVSNRGEPVKSDPAETRYGVAVDVQRAADFYAQGWTLRQIAAELGLTETTVSDQLRRAGVTMRRPGAAAYSASTDQIVELRDQGLIWNEIAEQVGMTVSGGWSRYRRAPASTSPWWGRWQQARR